MQGGRLTCHQLRLYISRSYPYPIRTLRCSDYLLHCIGSKNLVVQSQWCSRIMESHMHELVLPASHAICRDANNNKMTPCKKNPIRSLAHIENKIATLKEVRRTPSKKRTRHVHFLAYNSTPNHHLQTILSPPRTPPRQPQLPPRKPQTCSPAPSSSPSAAPSSPPCASPTAPPANSTSTPPHAPAARSCAAQHGHRTRNRRCRSLRAVSMDCSWRAA